MKIIDPGHHYELTSYSPEEKYSGTLYPQQLYFVKKIGDRFPGNTGRPQHGSNCQEVIRALIDREKYLYNQIPCSETKSIIELHRASLFLFEIRAAREKGTGINPKTNLIEEIPPCQICGHIFPHSHT